MSESNLTAENKKSDSPRILFKPYYLVIPVLVALFILTYEDFLYNSIITPILYFLQTNHLIYIPSKDNISNIQDYNTYVFSRLMLNLILNFASLILIYFVFIKSKLLSSQVENKQYGIITTIKTFLSLFVIVTGILFLFTIIQTTYFPSVSVSSPYDSIFPTTPDYSMINLFLVILLVCIFAPVLEELIFRRILIPLLEGTGFISTFQAVIISATVFALIHSEADILGGSTFFAIAHFTSICILGTGLAAVYVATRNVKYTMFFHGLNNTLALVPQIINAYLYTDPNNPPDLLIYYGLFFLLLLIAGFVLLIIALVNHNDFMYPLKNQFKGTINKTKFILSIIAILGTQAVIFIVIPYLEDLLFNIMTDVLLKVIINALLYVVIFLGFVFVLKKNLTEIKSYASVQNKKLDVKINPYYQNYYPMNQPTMYTGPVNQPINTNQNQPQEQNQQLGAYSNQVTNKSINLCPECSRQIPENNVNFCPFCGFKF